MAWTLTEDAAEFDRRAGGYLSADPTLNTVPLTVVANMLAGRQAYDTTLFGWWTEGGEVTAAFMHTGPWPFGVFGVGEAARAELVALLDSRRHVIGAVNGEVAQATAFADAWAARRGRRTEVETGLRLYRLGELTPIAPAPPGAARLAAAGDRRLLARWLTEFGVELGELTEQNERRAAAFVGYGGAVFWEDGAPAAMAACSVPAFGVSRVGPVYTPPALRRRGYAGAATEAAVRRAWELKAEHVVLFTDLANPGSNALYQRLGFAPVADYAVLRLV